MTVQNLCRHLQFSPTLLKLMVVISASFDTEKVEEYHKAIRDYETARLLLPDPPFISGKYGRDLWLLAWSLKQATLIREFYREKNIPLSVYFNTMTCYRDFLQEALTCAGEFRFPYFLWCNRQNGGHLFRLGALEFEKKEDTIAIHIPDNTDLSPASVDATLEEARVFFETYFPECAHFPYTCHSWLLDPTLKEMLPEDSNIIRFQERFELDPLWEETTDHFRFLFNTYSHDLEPLAENTSLQRSVKAHLLAGGAMHIVLGYMK